MSKTLEKWTLVYPIRVKRKSKNRAKPQPQPQKQINLKDESNDDIHLHGNKLKRIKYVLTMEYENY